MNTVDPIKRKKDIDKMKRALEGNRDKLLFTVGINSALRISDILSLKVGDVFNDNGKIKDSLTVKETKTRKSKRFKLNQSIKTALRKHVEDPTDRESYLFKSRKGTNQVISRVTAYRILDNAADKVGLHDIRIGTHTLRKTFAYHAYNAGVPLETLQAILNHSSSKETLKYIGITQENIDEVYVKVDL
ncbi:site-specific integrase [Salibacterium salarium]|uniref:Site-specific integrase n=1 Tax=Salibacterium salarium TaxID=284579 RepID=A0A428NAF4_9BACI|nr:tyrosine-type recombinase/integrase [Salibacterium salarium]RSL35310.1 site-specific integrase [Salibacterium salarium]